MVSSAIRLNAAADLESKKRFAGVHSHIPSKNKIKEFSKIQ